MLQDAVTHPLEIIGEAAGHVSEECRESHREIPWHKMIGMRNRLIHEYFRVNYGTDWDTVKDDLPELVQLLEEIIPRNRFYLTANLALITTTHATAYLLTHRLPVIWNRVQWELPPHGFHLYPHVQAFYLHKRLSSHPNYWHTF